MSDAAESRQRALAEPGRREAQERGPQEKNALRDAAEALWDTLSHLLTMLGMGPATATQPMLPLDVSDLPDHDRLASNCGLSPRNRHSGTSLTRCPFNSVSSSRQGNAQLKNLLIFGCTCLARSVGYFREYERCQGRMSHKATPKAVARKRLCRKTPRQKKTPLVGQRRPALPRTTPQYHRRSGA